MQSFSVPNWSCCTRGSFIYSLNKYPNKHRIQTFATYNGGNWITHDVSWSGVWGRKWIVTASEMLHLLRFMGGGRDDNTIHEDVIQNASKLLLYLNLKLYNIILYIVQSATPQLGINPIKIVIFPKCLLNRSNSTLNCHKFDLRRHYQQQLGKWAGNLRIVGHQSSQLSQPDNEYAEVLKCTSVKQLTSRFN